MTLLAYWHHNLSPFVPYLQFTDTIGVRWYGLAYVLGFVGGAWLFLGMAYCAYKTRGFRDRPLTIDFSESA